ncbi:MAG: hypothetical protein WC700_07775 [Gemmatimonadaceae bacterium]|jgi:hypothetical protein
MDELPDEMVRLVLWEARAYTPALRCVCRRWRGLVATQREHFRRQQLLGSVFDFTDLAYNGHVSLIRWIIAERPLSTAELNQILDGAASGGHESLAKLACELGATDFDSALVSATQGGHMAITEWARERGATNFNHMLYAAAGANRLEFASLAREWGADDFKRPAYAAARAGHIEMVKLIQLECQQRVEHWVLCGGAYGGHTSIVDLALAWGADNYNRMLTEATGGGQLAMAQRARALGGGSDNFGVELVLAAKTGRRDMVDLVSSWQTTTDPSDILRGAALGNQFEMAVYARSLGARNYDDMLACAARMGHLAAACLARAWGATDFNDMLYATVESRNIRMAKLARAWGADDLDGALRAAASIGSVELAELVRSWGATALFSMVIAAVQSCHVSIVKLARKWDYQFDSNWLLIQSAANGFADGVHLAREWGARDFARAAMAAAQRSNTMLEATLREWAQAAADPESPD